MSSGYNKKIHDDLILSKVLKESDFKENNKSWVSKNKREYILYKNTSKE